MAVKHIVAIGIGLLFIISGVVLYVVIGNLQRKGFEEALTLDGPDDPVMAAFTDPYDAKARPVYTTFYVFNLTNVAEVKAGTEKPNLQEVGPFAYRTYVSRSNVTFSEDGNFVDLVEKWEYRYEPSEKYPSDTDVMITNFNPFYPTVLRSIPGGETTLNLMLVSAAIGKLYLSDATAWGSDPLKCKYSICSIANYTSSAITFGATHSTAILTAFSNATKMLGYLALVSNLTTNQAQYGPIMNAAFADFGIDHTSVYGLAQAGYLSLYILSLRPVARALTAAGLSLSNGLLFRTLSAHDTIFGPDTFLSNVVGSTAGLVGNGTVYPVSTLSTGKLGVEFMNFDYYTQVRGKRWTNVYGPNVSCEGRGSSIAPFMDTLPDMAEVYNGETQRVLTMVKGAEGTLKDVAVQKYDVAWDQIFVVDETMRNPYPGMINVGPAAGGSPIFMGFPNYGRTDLPAAVNTPDWIRNAVTGVNSSHHVESFITIEPVTGLPAEALKAVQINMLINVTGLQDAPDLTASSRVLMLPVIWSNQSMILTDSQAKDLYKGTVEVRNLRIALIVVFIGVGALVIVLGVAFLATSGPSDVKYSEDGKTATPQ